MHKRWCGPPKVSRGTDKAGGDVSRHAGSISMSVSLHGVRAPSIHRSTLRHGVSRSERLRGVAASNPGTAIINRRIHTRSYGVLLVLVFYRCLSRLGSSFSSCFPLRFNGRREGAGRVFPLVVYRDIDLDRRFPNVLY